MIFGEKHIFPKEFPIFPMISIEFPIFPKEFPNFQCFWTNFGGASTGVGRLGDAGQELEFYLISN